MAHWNYRVLNEKQPDGSDWLTLREVYYNDQGEIYAYTLEPIAVCSESLIGLKQVLEWMKGALEKEILVEGEVVFGKAPYGEDTDENKDVLHTVECFFCEKEKAVIRVKNKVGEEFYACEEHGALALSTGYDFISANIRGFEITEDV